MHDVKPGLAVENPINHYTLGSGTELGKNRLITICFQKRNPKKGQRIELAAGSIMAIFLSGCYATTDVVSHQKNYFRMFCRRLEVIGAEGKSSGSERRAYRILGLAPIVKEYKRR